MKQEFNVANSTLKVLLSRQCIPQSLLNQFALYKITESAHGMKSKETQKQKFMVYVCETAASVSGGIWAENQTYGALKFL